MHKRLATPALLLFCAFALATIAHFLPERIADSLIIISMLIAATGSWFLFKQCRA